MKRLLACATCALALAASAEAATLNTGSNNLAGTTSGAEPNLVGLIVEDETTAFTWNQAGGTLNGTIQSRVVLSDDGTYDFYWRIFDLRFAGTGNMEDIGNFRVGEFGVPIAGLNGNYRTDGLGSVGPDTAFVFGPGLDDYVNFAFDANSLGLGETSYFMFLDTQATTYGRTAIMDVANGSTTSISNLYTTFGVSAVPEPASWAMMVVAFGLIGAGMRGRITLRARRPAPG